jgi:glycosyltransferase involved in cell wall biosynthesis
MSRLPILADAEDTWYAYHYPDLCELFEPLVQKNFPAWIIWLMNRFAIARGWLFFLQAKKYPFALTTTTTRSAKAFFFFEALLGSPRKHLILLEFIQQENPNSPSFLSRAIYHLWLHWILKRALRKSLLTAHVLTERERSHYGELFEIPQERFVFNAWPKIRKNDRFPKEQTSASTERSVVCSGREACDWETVFKAAEGQNWRLRIICSSRDLQKVQHLNVNGLADVLCEIPREEHEREVKEAAVYVLSLLERERSSGHVRISDATRAGTAIVATAVKGIEGYIDDGKTGLLVPPGDAIRLRAAVNRLLADILYRRTLARNAFDQAANHTREHYMEKIDLIIRSAVERNAAVG